MEMEITKNSYDNLFYLVQTSNKHKRRGLGHSDGFIHELIETFFFESDLTNIDLSIIINNVDLKVGFNEENSDDTGAEGVSIYEYEGTYIIYTYEFIYEEVFGGETKPFVNDHFRMVQNIDPISFIRDHEIVKNDLRFVSQLFMILSNDNELSKYMSERYSNFE
jgi:hypothetical protein